MTINFRLNDEQMSNKVERIGESANRKLFVYWFWHLFFVLDPNLKLFQMLIVEETCHYNLEL